MVLVLLTLSSFPFLYVLLELPKLIINKAIGGEGFPKTYYGYEFSQTYYLFLLCAVFFTIVVINGIFKYFINMLQGRAGERLLKLLRYRLYLNTLRFPLPYFRKMSSGGIVTIIAAEVQVMGGFIGEAIATPVWQFGTLVTILFFMFMQEPYLGVAAIALYPIQMYIIPKMQRQVNVLSRERVERLGHVAGLISESVDGVTDVHTHDYSKSLLHRFSIMVDKVYHIRVALFKKKYLIKFINNFLGMMTPFFFYSIGGYFVIMGELTLGALIATLAAYERLADPWKTLLKFYQQQQDVQIKFEQVLERFEPSGMLPVEKLWGRDRVEHSQVGIEIRNLCLETEIMGKVLKHISLKVRPGEHVAFLGKSGSGKDELGLAIAKLLPVDKRRIWVGGHDINTMFEYNFRQTISYVGSKSYIFSGTLLDNLLLALPSSYDDVETALRTDCLPQEFSPQILEEKHKLWEALRVVGLDADVYNFGFARMISEDDYPEATAAIIKVRKAFASAVKETVFALMIEPFNTDQYHPTLSVLDNLLFGSSADGVFSLESIMENEYFLEVLEKTGLQKELSQVGYQMTAITLELFAGVSSGSSFYEQHSYIRPDELEYYRALHMKAEKDNLDNLQKEDIQSFIFLALRLKPSQNSFDVLEENILDHILNARHFFRENLPECYQGQIQFFHADHYNSSASVRDNIFFGRVGSIPQTAQEKLENIFESVIDQEGLRETIMSIGLDYHVGAGGSRLSSLQQQRIGLARCVLRDAPIVVINGALAAFDKVSQYLLRDRLLEHFKGKTVLWMMQRTELCKVFEHIYVMNNGIIVEEGSFSALNNEHSLFVKLLGDEL